MRKRRISDNALQLSFLDVLSCGLGAAVLLFLVFSLIGEDQPLDLSSPDYIMIRGKLNDANTNVILRTFIVAPNGEQARLCMERNTNYCIDMLKAGEPYDLGGSKVLLSLTPETVKRHSRMFAIRVLQPTTGPWKIAFRYDMPLQLVHYATDLNKETNVDLDLELTTRDKPKGEKYKLSLVMNRRSNCGDVVEPPSHDKAFCPAPNAPFKFIIK